MYRCFVYMYVYSSCAWFLEKLEEAIGPPRLGVEGFCCHVGALFF